LNLDNKTHQDINTLARKLDTYAKQERDIKVSLQSSDLYDITGAVKKGLTDNLEKATEDVVKETNEFRVKSQNEIKQATNELISYSKKLKDETEKYKKWYVSAMIGFVVFAVVLLLFTMLADMPFLDQAYQFIATKIEHSKTWYVTGLWYLAYLITPMCWVGVVTGVAYLLHRWYTD
jgi:Fe2+ transport system protein B